MIDTNLPEPLDDEDTVECLWCTERVHTDFVISTDAGHVCDTCMENMS